MNVSTSFFNGVAKYSDGWMNSGGKVSMEWVYHPMNWQCGTFDHYWPDHCFKPAKMAREFFNELLQPLEAHYGNCQQALPESRYTILCPSNHNYDILTLNVNWNTMGFESSKGSGKCWFNPGVHNWMHEITNEDRAVYCEAWSPMERKNRTLNFKLHAENSWSAQHVSEYDDSQKRKLFSSAEVLDMIRHPERYAPEKDVKFDSPFVQFVRSSPTLKKLVEGNNWINADMGVVAMKAFAAATESKPEPVSKPATSCPEPVVCPKPEPVACPTPKPVACPKPDPADDPIAKLKTSTESAPKPTACPIQQSTGSTFSWTSGIIGVVVGAVSAIALNRLLKPKKQAQPLPMNQPHRIRNQAN